MARRFRQLVSLVRQRELGVCRQRADAAASCQHQRPSNQGSRTQISLGSLRPAAGRSSESFGSWLVIAFRVRRRLVMGERSEAVLRTACPAMTAITLISSPLANKALNISNGAADCYCGEATTGEGHMIGPRRAIFLGLLALSAVWTHSSVRADQSFQRFLPLLVELDGWQVKNPDGMSMEIANITTTTA